MLVTRQDLEAREAAWLAPCAMQSSASRGRAYSEEEHAYRTAYQRDRDRIIHTTAFRRLEYKTQVFVYSEGDHYRNRLTHSIEVAQIGRTLARALGANEDLIEAICLSHDLGHPPFGHQGEATLNDIMREHGGYDHQRQTYRIVTELEERYPDFPGLNLTYEVREGIVKHDTHYDVLDARNYKPDERGTLECQLSNLADEIAYNTSDLDDGLRSGILKPSEVRELRIARWVLESLGETGAVDLREPLMRRRFIRRMVGVQVNGTIEATEARLASEGVGSIADLRALAGNVACYTERLERVNEELRSYLFDNFYRHYRVVRMATKADRLIHELFEAYAEEPQQLPDEVQRKVEQRDDGLHRTICDYIAGMTDRYAIQDHKRLYDPEERV